MPNLQEHMFRVAAVASLICDNFNESLPKEEIITGCLLHDMGNIVKSNFEFMPQFLEPQGLRYWEGVKNEFIQKYGKNDHQANLKIAKEIGISPKAMEVISGIDFFQIPYLLGKSFEDQISYYADCRVSPFGVVSVHDRYIDVKSRYLSVKDEEWQMNEETMGKVEKNIFTNCKIKPEDVNDASIAPIIAELKNFVIHSTKTKDHGE